MKHFHFLGTKKQSYLRVKDLAGLDRVAGVAQDEAGGDVGLLDALQLHLHVLAAHHLRNLDVVGPQSVDLDLWDEIKRF